MEENPDWIPAGIWNGRKPGLDSCWNTEWEKTWTGFLLNMEWEIAWTGFLLEYGMVAKPRLDSCWNMEWEKNPDWIPAGIWNGRKTQTGFLLEYGMGEKPGLDSCWNMEWEKTWTGFLLEYGMGENLDWISAEYGMGDSLDWIPAGIWNGRKTRTGFLLEYGMGEKPRLDSCWNMEWEKNPDWIPAGIQNGGKTRFCICIGIWNGGKPDWIWVRIWNGEGLNQASQASENRIKVFKIPVPQQQQKLISSFPCAPALKTHLRCLSSWKGSCSSYRKSKEEPGRQDVSMIFEELKQSLYQI
ncbi:hypothetical protein HGM15179_009462 [Zosterops borbonicus]|uniref:Uncharacterized protein n=1 Tax=Zosterops borbonicus TaxID=364589 RepID=A0A8K1LKK5_9PASS|nr:hypothetical protein HGM15179_009462 [Zosterops borbonicus]